MWNTFKKKVCGIWSVNQKIMAINQLDVVGSNIENRDTLIY